MLRTATGIDFTYYKHNTILRRIERRMALHGIESVEDYARKLRHDTAEAKVLAQEFLINVTAFFREPETYKTLKDTVFPALLEHRLQDDPIRVWIPGCSTGEEAYSVAIVLTEFLEEHGATCGIQIFATDLSDSVIEKARAGVYLENAVTGVSAERLRRFFVSRDRVYQINQSIRGACVFAKQDLTKDPPFSKIDLISCCNLLIYLGPLLQKARDFFVPLRPEARRIPGVGKLGIHWLLCRCVPDSRPQAKDLFQEDQLRPAGLGPERRPRQSGRACRRERIAGRPWRGEERTEVCGSDAAGRILAARGDRR